MIEYDPVKDGMDKVFDTVKYTITKPPEFLSAYVHSFWELKTGDTLAEDFILHAVPDACTNIMLNQMDTTIAGLTALRTRFTQLNLGKSFYFVGIQLHPGVWQDKEEPIFDSYIGRTYQGNLPLIKLSREIKDLDFADKIPLMSVFVNDLVDSHKIKVNPIISQILTNCDSIFTVTDMAEIASLSARQLQRRLKQDIGLTPHDFLKILRLQSALREHDFLMHYTDQAHYIKEFRKMMGDSPNRFHKKYDV